MNKTSKSKNKKYKGSFKLGEIHKQSYKPTKKVWFIPSYLIEKYRVMFSVSIKYKGEIVSSTKLPVYLKEFNRNDLEISIKEEANKINI